MNEFLNAKFNLYFDVSDRDKDGYVTLEDYVGQVDKLAEIRNLDLDDPRVVADRTGIMNWWLQFKQATDANDDGKVNREEFIQFWMQLSLASRGDSPEAEAIRKSLHESALNTFQVIDGDKDGHVTLEEYTDYLTSVNHVIDYSETFNKLTNGKATLSEADVTEIVEDFVCSTDTSVRGNLLFGPLPE